MALRLDPIAVTGNKKEQAKVTERDTNNDPALQHPSANDLMKTARERKSLRP
jgi:hypothetical protein